MRSFKTPFCLAGQALFMHMRKYIGLCMRPRHAPLQFCDTPGKQRALPLRENGCVWSFVPERRQNPYPPPRVSVRGAMRRSIRPGRGPAHTGSWPPGAGPARPSALPPRDNASGPAGQGRSGQAVRHGPPHGRAPDKPWGRAPTIRFPPAAGSCPCVRAASSNLPFPVIINKNLPKRKASAGVRQGRIRVTGRDSSRSRRRACRSPREERCTSRS